MNNEPRLPERWAGYVFETISIPSRESSALKNGYSQKPIHERRCENAVDKTERDIDSLLRVLANNHSILLCPPDRKLGSKDVLCTRVCFETFVVLDGNAVQVEASSFLASDSASRAASAQNGKAGPS